MWSKLVYKHLLLADISKMKTWLIMLANSVMHPINTFYEIFSTVMTKLKL